MLNDWASVEVEASRQDFSEQLGKWVGVFDAMTLHAAHQARPAGDGKKTSDVLTRASALEEEFHRVRTTLVKSITASGAASVSGTRLPQSVPPTDSAVEANAGYPPYHQRYLDQQRQMALRIDALRAYARQALAKVSPPLEQLASFDAVMEQMFGDREQKLLSSVPVMLERRFEHLRKTRQSGEDETVLHKIFGKEMQEVLLAELEVRLQPVAGLIEAFSKEVKKQP